jgi:hypothetical protein
VKYELIVPNHPFKLNDDWSLLYKLLELYLKTIPKSDISNYSQSVREDFIKAITQFLINLNPNKYQINNFYNALCDYTRDEESQYYLRYKNEIKDTIKIADCDFDITGFAINVVVLNKYSHDKLDECKFYLTTHLNHLELEEDGNNIYCDQDIGPIPLEMYLEKICKLKYSDVKLFIESEMFRLL